MDSSSCPIFFLQGDAEKRAEIRVKPKITYQPWELSNGTSVILDSLPVRIDQGKKFYDILSFQDPHNFAVSERIYNLLIQEGITGWRSYPLAIEGADEKYYGMQITGRAGPPLASIPIGFIDGMDFDRNTWDGSDMFLLEGTLFTIFSERLRNLLVKNKTSNLELDEISTVRWYNH
jgi:hypothetical protein